MKNFKYYPTTNNKNSDNNNNNNNNNSRIIISDTSRTKQELRHSPFARIIKG